MRILLLLFAFSLALPEFAKAQDRPTGEAVFSKQCKDCHNLGTGGGDKRGPGLNGLFGKRAGSVPGYDYSDANRDSQIVWDDKTLRDYIRNPQSVIPGTRKRFPGLTDEQEIEDLVRYLKQFEASGEKR